MKIKTFTDMLDATAVQFNMEREEVQKLVDFTIEYQPKAIGLLPEYWEWVMDEYKASGNTFTKIIGTCGFPTGLESTEQKLVDIDEGLKLGAREIDITNNISFVKDGAYDKMAKELKTLVEHSAGCTTKVIVETPKLTPEEIVNVTKVVAESGADMIKTATGHYGVTMMEHVQTIYSVYKDQYPIKAAGGIRDLATIEAMMEYNVVRFGIGIRAIDAIMKECE